MKTSTAVFLAPTAGRSTELPPAFLFPFSRRAVGTMDRWRLVRYGDRYRPRLPPPPPL